MVCEVRDLTDLYSLEEILRGHDSSAYPPQLSSTSLLKLNVTKCRWCQLEVNYSLNTLYLGGNFLFSYLLCPIVSHLISYIWHTHIILQTWGLMWQFLKMRCQKRRILGVGLWEILMRVMMKNLNLMCHFTAVMKQETQNHLFLQWKLLKNAFYMGW